MLLSYISEAGKRFCSTPARLPFPALRCPGECVSLLPLSRYLRITFGLRLAGSCSKDLSRGSSAALGGPEEEWGMWGDGAAFLTLELFVCLLVDKRAK